MEDVWKDGAVMLISMIFDCKLADNYCNTWIESSVVDSSAGSALYVFFSGGIPLESGARD